MLEQGQDARDQVLHRIEGHGTLWLRLAAVRTEHGWSESLLEIVAGEAPLRWSQHSWKYEEVLFVGSEQTGPSIALAIGGPMTDRADVIDLLRHIRASEVRIAEAYAALGELSDEGRSRFGANSLVFDTPDGYVWVPDQYELQCVASTRKGARCRNVVFDQGQVWVYDVGPIARLDDQWLARLLTQTCRRHDEVQADHYAPTEWVFIPRSDVSPGP